MGLPDWVRGVGGDVTVARQRAVTGDWLVQLRHAGLELDPRSIRALTAGTDGVTAHQGGSWAVDVLDRAERLLGRVYGSEGAQLAQRAATLDLLVQLRHAGVELDPRQVRALTSSDVVSAVQSGAWSVGVNNHPATYDVSDRAARLLGHVDVDSLPAVDVTDRSERQVGRVYGDQGAQLAQRAATLDLLVQLRHAGVELDPRQVRALTASDVVTVDGGAMASLQYVQRPTERAGRTYVAFSGDFDGSNAVTVHTVAANKVLYVTTLLVSALNANTAGNQLVDVRDGTTRRLRLKLPPKKSQVTGQNDPDPPHAHVPVALPEPLQITESLTIKGSQALLDGAVSGVGYEE